MLALLLARHGIDVTLLESHLDFERDFRGDTLHASVLEILDELGLADALHALPHSSAARTVYVTDGVRTCVSDYGSLRSRFPYIFLLPQSRFLDFITTEAARQPTYRAVMGARVRSLIERDGRVAGVRYVKDGETHELMADLVVGADGRFSTVRGLAGIELVREDETLFDVLWFRLPRRPTDPSFDLESYFGRGYYISLFDRGEYWQLSYSIEKGGYRALRERGIETLREGVRKLIPALAENVATLTDWSQVTLLSIELGHVTRWYRPGLLLIGDAAHVMSPVAGVGINCAIHDAVAAANVLCEPLRAGRVRTRHLAEVQLRREWVIWLLQRMQTSSQRRIFQRALDPNVAFRVPTYLRLPLMAQLSARLIAYGIHAPRPAGQKAFA